VKKKINSQFVGIAFTSVIAAILLAILMFYDLFVEQVFQDLKTDAYLLKSNEVMEEIISGENELESYNIRVTLIDQDGEVLIDTRAEETSMDNHTNRPEIKEAFHHGEGMSIRQSSTLEKNSFYYALRLEGGQVLRVAKEAHSIWNIFNRAIPLTVLLICVLFVLCVVFSRLLARNLLKPIERMAENMEAIEQVECYEEIRPFIETIRMQHEKILQSAHIRQEFTANVSHELKTPLTAISGYSELIENGMATKEDVRRFGGEIHRNANRLLTLINDIIKLSELDGSAQEFEFETVNLYQIASDSVDMLQLSAEKNKVSLEFHGGLCYILGDRQMIEELVYNLCDNAIRYNNVNGNVWVSVGKFEDKVVLKVKDTGIGIPKEHQERIFERFYRVDKSRSKSTGGTGLGLAIVKHIVARHDATITLESDQGNGTEITIYFNVYDADALKKLELDEVLE